MRALLARGGSAGFGPAPIRSRGLPTAGPSRRNAPSPTSRRRSTSSRWACAARPHRSGGVLRCLPIQPGPAASRHSGRVCLGRQPPARLPDPLRRVRHRRRRTRPSCGGAGHAGAGRPPRYAARSDTPTTSATTGTRCPRGKGTRTGQHARLSPLRRRTTAAPPEDCGGIWGYADLTHTLTDPTHPGHDDMLDWLGLNDAADFDPAEFDAQTVTKALSGCADGARPGQRLRPQPHDRRTRAPFRFSGAERLRTAVGLAGGSTQPWVSHSRRGLISTASRLLAAGVPGCWRPFSSLTSRRSPAAKPYTTSLGAAAGVCPDPLGRYSASCWAHPCCPQPWSSRQGGPRRRGRAQHSQSLGLERACPVQGVGGVALRRDDWPVLPTHLGHGLARAAIVEAELTVHPALGGGLASLRSVCRAVHRRVVAGVWRRWVGGQRRRPGVQAKPCPCCGPRRGGEPVMLGLRSRQARRSPPPRSARRRPEPAREHGGQRAIVGPVIGGGGQPRVLARAGAAREPVGGRRPVPPE